MTPCPRPILKRDSPPLPLSNDLPFVTCDHILSPHVHFPPTPWMISTSFTHSPHSYDRAPIAISPNECLLPKRGERKLQSPPAHYDGERRGRSRSRSRSRDSDSDEEDVKDSYFHPRAYEACNPEPLHVPVTKRDLSSPPSLAQDISPSDESDNPVATPPDPTVSALITTTIPPSFVHSAKSRAPHSGLRDRPAGGREDAPLLPRSSLRFAKTLFNGQKDRPNLKESGARPVVSFSPDRDEGCLGGF